MKKVTFNEKCNELHHLITWSFAYSMTRRKYWELLAVDRFRFCRRIEAASKLLDPILDTNHRCKIFSERFEIKTTYQIKFVLFN